MNLFILSWNLKLCVQWHFNSHVVKMPIELAQLLSTAYWILCPSKKLEKWREKGLIYRPIRNKNHCCAVWTRQHINNYKFVCQFGLALCDEYYYRYGKEKNRQHATRKIIEHLYKNIPDNFPKCQEPLITSWKVTLPPLAMPDKYKVEGKTLTSYRNWYRSDEKSHITKWKKRDIPEWFTK